MTGPAGSGHPQSPAISRLNLARNNASNHSGGFASLVNNLVQHKKDGEGSGEHLPDDVKPSKGLPSTGLKRNTKEWKEEHGDCDGCTDYPNGHDRRKHRSGSVSSSSSIPSDVGPDETPEKEEDQEGAMGRGKGRHEERILQNGDAGVMDSPTQEEPESMEENGNMQDKNTPPKERSESHSLVDGGTAGNGAATRDGGHGLEEDLASHREQKVQQGHEEKEGGANRLTYGDDPDQKIISRDDERQRKLTDEAGRYPDGLKGVKGEEPPGPRLDIVLDPRISHMHYHSQRADGAGKYELGPILKVTSDGEHELPPGQTPGPSRTPSHQNSDLDSERQDKTDAADEQQNGHWSYGMEQSPSRRAPSHNRFSSFRDSTAESDSGNQSRPHLHLRSQSSNRARSTHEPEGQEGAEGSDNREGREGRETSDEDAQSPAKEQAQRRWSALRSRVLPGKNAGAGPAPGANKVTALSHTAIGAMPVTTELLAGQLPVMILKTWMDRDDEGHRAVPVLLGNLRFRVGDSVGLGAGRETGKEMFKVECEYGDGVVKWVIYRELRDFLSLHAHYKAANFGTSVAGLRTSRRVEIPEFPRMSIPYLNKLGNQQGREKPVSKSEYAQASRDALQNYLVELIRAVIFRPESNRLCKFFELSSLTLSLAPRGGFQGKAGYLKIPGSNASRRANQPGLTPTSWLHNREPKWFIVRDTYFVATDGPDATEFYDVFMLDEGFSIERPKRVLRTGLHIMTGHSSLRSATRRDVPLGHEKSSGRDAGGDGTGAEGEDGIDLDNPFAQEMIVASGEAHGQKIGVSSEEGDEHHASQHTFFIVNTQRRLKLVAKNARQMHQFIVSMERIAAQSVWTGRNRFDSFAPLRVNVAAQWLVDGRDYFWNLSRAINMAKDRIYIHDWWISPELYLRRPGNERYRLDNLLKRKAEDGVKIFIIVYNEVSDKTTPVDSSYTKRTLTGLHPNIMVQRSPSHFQTGTFYWSHHEKLCVIDETIAFMGGLDLCYGRWDTSQHILTDEDYTEETGPNGPVWRGKDYSNERVAEYSNLDKPFEDVFDRGKVPRMPWHDVGMQIVGQPARDLCRHFVQRWNLLIRTKNHKRRMPFLLPAADFTERELHDLKLQGTCEVQICRSVGPWSMGTLTKIEHSIQNAYVKSIELSEHFVYIENQFFITSTVVDGVPVQNGIGDALVSRIIKAHKQGTPWKACIVIPLLPGYTYPIDSNEASSVRLIMECQNRTICRGTHSIFSRLKKEGIDPDDYINFFSLRGWAKFKSGVLTTEQVYIHGKTMIVDDRLVLCGSANINERSQRGDRDSELLAVIRDTDMIDGTMAGKPFKVGRFAHTLRMRLMREHVGVDVDAIEEDQLMNREPVAPADEVETWDPDHEQEDGDDGANRGVTKVKARTAMDRFGRTVKSGMGAVTKGMSENLMNNIGRTADKVIHPVALVAHGEFAAKPDKPKGEAEEREDFDLDGNRTDGFASSVVSTLEEKTIYERRPSASHANGQPLFDLIEEGEGGLDESGPKEAYVDPKVKDEHTILDGDKDASKRGVPRIRGDSKDKEPYGAPSNAVEKDDAPPNEDTKRDDDTEEQRQAVAARKTLRKHLTAKVGASPWSMPTPTPKINPNRFHDPLDETFWKDMWVATAVHNTEIFRKVFRCIPDDLVTTWAAYKAFANHAEKFNRAPEDVAQGGSDEPPKVVHGGPGTHGAGGGGSGGGAVGQGKEGEAGGEKEKEKKDKSDGKVGHGGVSAGLAGALSGGGASDEASSSTGGTGGAGGSSKHAREASGPNDAWAQWEREEMEELLNEVRGHLVLYSTRFLEQEDTAGQFLFQSDRILPLPIYD